MIYCSIMRDLQKKRETIKKSDNFWPGAFLLTELLYWGQIGQIDW